MVQIEYCVLEEKHLKVSVYSSCQHLFIFVSQLMSMYLINYS